MKRVEIRTRILADNDAAADILRQRFAASSTLAIDLVSSPGSGKTALLKATGKRLGANLRLAAIAGDIATELDAGRLRQAGLRAHQILTGGPCHLDARMVTDALTVAPLLPADILFIENVGNLICPASYALGEDFKVALLSVAEGDDRPLKYPAIFARAAVTVIAKVDLRRRVRFDMARAKEQILALNPDALIIETSTYTGSGMSQWCQFLTDRVSAKTLSAITPTLETPSEPAYAAPV